VYVVDFLFFLLLFLFFVNLLILLITQPPGGLHYFDCKVFRPIERLNTRIGVLGLSQIEI
jgi:hypothetical protein